MTDLKALENIITDMPQFSAKFIKFLICDEAREKIQPYRWSEMAGWVTMWLKVHYPHLGGTTQHAGIGDINADYRIAIKIFNFENDSEYAEISNFLENKIYDTNGHAVFAVYHSN